MDESIVENRMAVKVKARKSPRSARILNPIIKGLVRMGVPMRPIILLTVHGRKTGKPYTTPVGLFALDGRRFLFSTFGESNWVRNLRNTGVAIIRRGRHRERVKAVELPREEATMILKNAMTPYFDSRFMGRTLRSTYNVSPESTLSDWKETAINHPVFELQASNDTE